MAQAEPAAELGMRPEGWGRGSTREGEVRGRRV